MPTIGTGPAHTPAGLPYREGAALGVPLAARVTTSPSGTGGGPRQAFIDVSFPAAPVVLHRITFTNYYTASITLSHTSTRAEGDPLLAAHMKGRAPTWSVALARRELMADPHYEDDAEWSHEVLSEHFEPGFDHQRVTRLRICCVQPSPSWREYGLRDLRFYTIEPPPPAAPPPPALLTQQEKDLSAAMLRHLVGLGESASLVRSTITAGMRNPAYRCADPQARALAPYVIGEWDDELRPLPLDGPINPPPDAVPPPARGVPDPTLEAALRKLRGLSAGRGAADAPR